MNPQQKMKTKQLLKHQLLALVTGVGVFAALWAMPETAHGQTPTPTPTLQGGDLFATVNIGGTYVNGASTIYRYTPDGSSSIFASALDTPRGLAFDNILPPNGPNLYVATTTTLDASTDPPTTQGTILKITPDGLMSTFGTAFPVSFLQGLATDSAGNVFVTAQVPPPSSNPNANPPSTIYKITLDGMVRSFAVLPGTGWGLAFDSAGNLYVATVDSPAVDANGEILKFTPDYNPSLGTGMVTTFVGPAAYPSPSPGPSGLAFDASGNLFVSSQAVDGTGDIRKFRPDGTEITPRFAAGLTKNPRGLAFDSAGNLFLAELGFNFSAITGDILEFTPGGAQCVFSSQGFGFRWNHGPEWLAFTTATVTPPSSAVTLTFPDATTPLTTTVTSVDQNSVPLPPSNFELQTGSTPLAFEITATTPPTPPIIIAFTVPASLDVSTLSVLHYDPVTSGCDTSCTLNCNPSCWVDSTIHYECDNQNPPNCNWKDSTGTFHTPGQGGYPASPAPNTVYASVNSLSPFLIAKFKYAAQIQQPIKADGSSVFSVKRGVLTVTFTLTSDGVATCQLAPATISVFRTAGGVVGSIAESTYVLKSDKGSNFRISNCQYVYNLSTSSLGPGTYLVNISIGGSLAGSGTFALK